MRGYIIFVIVLLACIGTSESAARDIIDHITVEGHTLQQPEALRVLLQRSESGASVSTQDEAPAGGYATGVRAAGFRVQIFSDNNRRTAQAEARDKARRLQNVFPQYRTYVSYTSPYWRLKVGDFGTHGEAEAVADEIRAAFPAYAKEVRVVRDNINVTSY